jgi:hypothetical protein
MEVIIIILLLVIIYNLAQGATLSARLTYGENALGFGTPAAPAATTTTPPVSVS